VPIDVSALLCPQCGGPLGKPAALPAIVECGFCGTALAVSSMETHIERAGAPDPAREAAVTSGRRAFEEAMRNSIGAGQDPETALRESAAAHLGAAGSSDTLARVAMALAREFEQQTGITVKKDAMVLARMANAYLNATSELRSEPETEINLPFLSADHRGPHHFQRKVTVATLAALAGGGITTAVAPALPPEPEPPAPKKKWWQF
jgi:hypothetical protein